MTRKHERLTPGTAATVEHSMTPEMLKLILSFTAEDPHDDATSSEGRVSSESSARQAMRLDPDPVPGGVARSR